jgi:RNA polymerase sigma factor (sigma-70 family)
MNSGQAGVVLKHLRRLAGARPAAASPDAELLARFAAGGDEAAFATLVRRHGPMVLGVCRSVLRHEQDAEDAFQATFLALARRADTIRWRGAVAGWLYGVAYHVAVKAQVAAARRRARERRTSSVVPADPALDMTLRELQRVLHEELRRLPEKYRLPLVLCYLEGRSHDEGAGLLGWTRSTFRGRLDRGRKHLRRRLAARGVAPSALLCATALAPRADADALVNAAAAAGRSARASALADGVSRALFTGKLKLATAVFLAAGLAAGAVALAQHSAAEAEGVKPPAAASPKPPPATAKPPAVEDRDSIAYAGRVLGPDGRPAAGAKLYMTQGMAYLWRPSPSSSWTTSGPDGRFAFKAPRAKFGEWYTVVAATAPGFGAGWVEVPAAGPRDNLTVRLAKDDGPITGQIVDLEGKPIAGATLTVLQINAAPGEDLGPWLEAVKARKGVSLALEQEYLKRHTIAVTPQVTTDGEGRFRLTGMGRNRLVRAQLDGPTIATQQLCILTRPGPTIEVPHVDAWQMPRGWRMVDTYYGARFRHVAAPTKPIVGVIRDRDTKKPLAGVTIQSYTLATTPLLDHGMILFTTDAQGRYRMTGMPKGQGNRILAVPGDDQPYLATVSDVADTPGLDPVTVDFALKRGVWIEGRITDKVTGKPVPGHLEYYALDGNPNLRDHEGFAGHHAVAAKEDGSYRIVGLAGPGLVAVYRNRHYLTAPERDDEYGAQKTSLVTAPIQISFTSNYCALARVNAARGVDVVKRDVTLDPGWTFTAMLLGPDGKPLTGAVPCFGPWWQDPDGTRTDAFTVRGFNPRRPSDVFFLHVGKGLVGVPQPPKENCGSVTVRMGPGAVVTGRLVDATGRPRAGVDLTVWSQTKMEPGWSRYYADSIQTDRDGRFRIGALLSGHEYRLYHRQEELDVGGGLRLGQTKDLGDVKMRGATRLMK